MEAPRREPGEPERVERPERFVSRVPEREYYPEAAVVGRDVVRWGPVAAGFVVTFGTLIFLGVLGLAFGLTLRGTTPPATVTEFSGAAIYGTIIMLIAFFVGGYMAGRSAAVRGAFSGLLNGGLVWAITLLVLAAFGAAGAGAFFGFAGAPFDMPTGTVAGLDPGSAAAWGAVGALILSLLAAVGGGIVGSRAHYRETTYVERRP